MELEQEAMVRANPSTESLDELRAASFEATGREIDEPFGIGLTGYETFEELAAAHPEDVADDTGDLDVGVLQGLLDALRVLRHLAHELLPGTCQVAELLHGRRRYEATSDEAVGQQIGDPHRVVHVGLATGYVPDVSGVGKDQLERTLEDVPDRLPVDAGRLHSRMCASVRGEPVAQREEPLCRRVERLHVLLDLTADDGPRARDHRLLVHVQARTSLVDNFHISSS